MKIKPLRKGKNLLLFTDAGKPCPRRNFFSLANMSFNAIHHNKILVKISKFTNIGCCRSEAQKPYKSSYFFIIIGLIDLFISVSQISKLNKTAQSDVEHTHKIYI